MTATRGGSAIQVVPWDTVNLLRPFFDNGPETPAARLLDLPVLRGAWACSVDSGGDWYDVSGHGHHLSYNGDPEFNYDGLVPYWDLDGTGDYFDWANVADNSILGTETYVAAAARGLLAGGWLWADALENWDYWFSKHESVGVNQRSWALYMDTVANARMRFKVSGDGTVEVFVPTDAALLTTGEWHCCFGRFVPSTSIEIFFDGQWWINTTSIPASLHNSTAPLVVGSFGTGAWNQWDGRASNLALCASSASRTHVNVFYHMTKRLYGH